MIAVLRPLGLFMAVASHPVFDGTCRQDDVEIVGADASAAFAAYHAEDGRQADREVVYNSDLGLAMEALPIGMSLSDLWNVV